MNIEAYILVGGKSSRFGSDKAVAEIGGTTLVMRAMEIVRDAFPESPIYFVAGDPNRFELGMLNAPVIFDQVADRGPVGGLHAALSNARSEWIFLFACDLPLMTSEFISQLHSEWDEGFDAVVPEQPDGRKQPLCAFYRVEPTLKLVSEMLDANPTAAMMAVIDKLKVRVVRSDVAELWTNMNRAEDLEEIARKLLQAEPI